MQVTSIGIIIEIAGPKTCALVMGVKRLNELTICILIKQEIIERIKIRLDIPWSDLFLDELIYLCYDLIVNVSD